jgi:phospholipase C
VNRGRGAVSSMRRYLSRTRWGGAALTLMSLALVALAATTLAGSASPARAATRPMCGNAGPAPQIRHVMVVMLENSSYDRTIGDTSRAPFQNNVLAKQCGLATHMWGATHTSAANYLALTAGQFPASSPRGCSGARACATNAPSLFSQLEGRGGWKNYVESMPHACAGASKGQYKVGHNPAVFYTGLSTCRANDVGVTNLSVRSGALWHDLKNKTLPAFSFISPNRAHDGDGAGLASADEFASKFIPLVTSSPAYRDGSTAVLVTYDEGNITKSQVVGENCTDQSSDLAGQHESCHIPFFVIYPFTPSGARWSGFATHYSVTRTVEELFGLPLLAHAQTAPSLMGAMGLHT